MMICKPGEIAEVSFPFIASSFKKLRSALVLSNSAFQHTSGACVLMMVTSAERSHWDTDIILEDWMNAGLRKPSILRWKIFTIDESLIGSVRGKLSERDCEKVSKSILGIFSKWMPEQGLENLWQNSGR